MTKTEMVMKDAHVECLRKLFRVSNCFDDIIEHLVADKVIPEITADTIYLQSDKTKALCHTLFKARNEDKLQLLHFEWTTLPVERILVRVITNMSAKEYTHNC
jgi:hypothetical protein